MPKRKLTDLAKEYNLSFENILEIASNNLEESSLSGRGKNTWVDETGQDVLDSNIPIEEPKPNKYRGRVRNKCPNPIYMMVHLKESPHHILLMNVVVKQKKEMMEKCI